VRVHRPKDLARLRNRMVFDIETRFPKAFSAVKKTAIRTMVRLNARRNTA
jgi:hypothetical protein